MILTLRKSEIKSASTFDRFLFAFLPCAGSDQATGRSARRKHVQRMYIQANEPPIQQQQQRNSWITDVPQNCIKDAMRMQVSN